MRRVASRLRVRRSPGYDVFLNDRVVRLSGRSFRGPRPPVGKEAQTDQNNCHVIVNKIGGPVSAVGIHDVTALPIEWTDGDPGAVARLLPLCTASRGALRSSTWRASVRPPGPSKRSTSGWWILVDG